MMIKWIYLKLIKNIFYWNNALNIDVLGTIKIRFVNIVLSIGKIEILKKIY